MVKVLIRCFLTKEELLNHLKITMIASVLNSNISCSQICLNYCEKLVKTSIIQPSLQDLVPFHLLQYQKKIYQCKNSKCKKMVLIYLQKLDYINSRPFTLCVNKKYLVPLSTKFFKRNLVTLKEQKSFYYYFGKHPFFALLIT